MKKFRRPIRNYFLSKIVGMFLVGTLHAAVASSPRVVQFAHAIAQAEGYNLKGSILSDYTLRLVQSRALTARL